MKFTLDAGKRSQLSCGGRLVAGLIFLSLAVSALFIDINPGWMRWVFCISGFAGLGTVLLWRARSHPELEEEDLIEMARQAIHSEAQRLENKRANLERVLMSYGEWMEFPDFDHLQKTNWKHEIQEGDRRIAEILDQTADKMLADFSTGVYWEDGKFQTRPLLIDLFNYVEKIAAIHNPDAEKPILETNLESLLKAVNRASLQVILLLEEIPIIDVKEMNIRKASDSIRKASKVYKKYEELQPLIEPVRYLWQGAKFLTISNPLLAAGWVAGSELLWKGGKKLGKKAMDAYLLSLVRQSLGIIAWETAGIYDKSYRYRNPDWVYGLELVHFASKFEPTTDLLRSVFKELGCLPLRSSYDRIFLYRCVANHVSPKPERFSANEWLPVSVSKSIEERLVEFSTKNLGKEWIATKDYNSWLTGLRKRIGTTPVVESTDVSG